jgi:hypothetical protein
MSDNGLANERLHGTGRSSQQNICITSTRKKVDKWIGALPHVTEKYEKKSCCEKREEREEEEDISQFLYRVLIKQDGGRLSHGTFEHSHD